MTQLDDIANGMEVAQKALLAIADDDEPAALAAINTATEGQAKHAAAFLLSVVREEAKAVAQLRKPYRPWQNRLRAAASDISDDIVTTLAAQIVHDAERDL